MTMSYLISEAVHMSLIYMEFKTKLVKEKVVKNRKAFTLIELLVVIAVIALLLSILLPALRMAKEQGRRVVCISMFKTIGLANNIYANECKDWFVPIDDDTVFPAGWYGNQAFIGYLALVDKEAYGKNVQEMYICPSASPQTASLSPPFNRFTFGPNITGMVRKDGVNPAGGAGTGYLGLKKTEIRSPANKLMYTDSNGNYLVSVFGADYELVWDLYGDVNGDYNISGWYSVAYRHAEGANALFCDGHVDYLNKEKMFNIEREDSNNQLWMFDQ